MKLCRVSCKYITNIRYALNPISLIPESKPFK